MAFLNQLLVRTMAAAAWFGPWLLAVILVLCLLADRWRSRRLAAGQLGGWRWPSWAVLTVFQVFAVTGLVMSLGPGMPIVSELRMLQHRTDQAMPEMTFRRVADDSPVSLTALRGKVVLLNVWATWCGPCIAEMPALEQVQQELSERGLEVVTLSDESREQLTAFFAENPVAATHLYTDALPVEVASSARPKSLLIDRGGVLRDFVFGAHDADFFSAWVEPLLE